MDPKAQMWLPPSHQFSGLKEAQQAVKDYDPDLLFGMNEATGQWCVFLRQGATELTSDKPLPVLGFNHIPSRDEVQKRLYQSDAVRRGHEILDDIQRHNDALKKELEDNAKDASDLTAEVAEWGLRMMDNPNAPVKVFMGKQTNKR